MKSRIIAGLKKIHDFMHSLDITGITQSVDLNFSLHMKHNLMRQPVVQSTHAHRPHQPDDDPSIPPEAPPEPERPSRPIDDPPKPPGYPPGPIDDPPVPPEKPRKSTPVSMLSLIYFNA